MAPTIALLGLGRIGTHHLATLISLGVGLVTYDPRFPETSTAASVDEAIAAADGVVIAASTDTHADLLRRTVNAGKPVFCEKPLTLSRGVGESLASDIQASGVPVQIGFQRRFDPGFVEARDRLARSDGAILGFQMRSLDAAAPTLDYLSVSGSMFVDCLIHDFDLVPWLFGEAPVSITACGTALDEDLVGLTGDVDCCLVTIRLASGAFGSLLGSRHNTTDGYNVGLEVFTTSGTIAVRSPESRRYADFIDRFSTAYAREMAHFVAIVRGEAEPICDADDAMAALRLAEAAETAWRTGTACSVTGPSGTLVRAQVVAEGRR